MTAPVSTAKGDQAAAAASAQLQVLAAGLPRCATSSLKVAFEELGLGPSMHTERVYVRVSSMKLLCSAFDERDAARRREILSEIFDGYQASADSPGCMFVEDLAMMYPRLKIVLNKRSSPQVWLRSVERALSFLVTRRFHATTYLVPNDYWFWCMCKKAKRYGLEVLKYTGDTFPSEAYYLWHCDNVRRIASEYGLEILEFEPDMGWEPLCDFLGRPVPLTPFPHKNDEDTMKLLTAFVLVRGALAWTVLLGGLGLLSYLLYRTFR